MTHDQVATPPRRPRRGFARYGVPLLLLLLPVLGGVLGFVAAQVTPPHYTASSYVLITTSGGSGGLTPVDVATAVARVATNESVLGAGASSRLLRASRDGDLTAKASPDAPLVELSATSSTAAAAASLANELAGSVQSHMATLTGAATFSANVFASASEPNKPSSPNPPVDLAAGVALGVLLAGVGFVLRRR